MASSLRSYPKITNSLHECDSSQPKLLRTLWIWYIFGCRPKMLASWSKFITIFGEIIYARWDNQTTIGRWYYVIGWTNKLQQIAITLGRWKKKKIGLRPQKFDQYRNEFYLAARWGFKLYFEWTKTKKIWLIKS